MSVSERFLGFIYRIFLSRTIGSEGLGLYQITLTVFSLLLTITSSGVPITVSRMITRHKAQNNVIGEHSTVSAGLLYCSMSAVIIVIFFYVSRDYLFFIFSDTRCMDALMIILHGLIFTSVYAVIRGAFWGNKDFVPYSVIELLEEAVMLGVGILLISYSSSMMDGLTRACYAVLISYIFSFITSSIVFFLKGGRIKNPIKEIKPLITSSTPITAMRTITSFINSLVAVLLPAMLISAGLTSTEAVSQFGEAYGMAIPILFMPATLIGSLAVVLVPELSENFYKNNNKALKSNIERALMFSIFIACMIIPLLISFGKPIGIFLYQSENSGYYLSHFSIIMLPMSLSMISTSMLNSLNLERKTLLFYLIGAGTMLLSIYFLPRYIGIYSLGVGLFLQFALTAIFNLILLSAKTKTNANYLWFALKSSIFIIPTALFGIMLKSILCTYLSIAISCLLGCIAVVAFILLLYITLCKKELLFIIKKM